MESTITGKIRALLQIAGKRPVDLARYLGVLPQSVQNKLSRGSFSAEDLIKIADFAGAELVLQIGEDRIVLGKDCIREKHAAEPER